MKIIYIVGPSSAGKSTLCKMLTQEDQRFEHLSLDEEVKQIAPNFKILNEADWVTRWSYCQQALDELSLHADPNRIYLLDSGAGALQTTQGQNYFINHPSQLVCVIADPDKIYPRYTKKLALSGEFQPKHIFLEFEYGETRQRVYKAARYIIDTSPNDVTKSLNTFKDAIAAILG
jgi:shikimate kinase